MSSQGDVPPHPLQPAPAPAADPQEQRRAEKGIRLRVCVLEKEDMVFSYPDNDPLLSSIYLLLHNIHVHSKKVVGAYAEAALLQRGGMKLVAIMRRVPSGKDTLLCALWAIGELNGGQVPPSVKVMNFRDGGQTFLSASGGSLVMGNEYSKGARITKLQMDSDRMILTVPEVGVNLQMDAPTAAKVQRLADTVGSVKHNIRLRSPWQTRACVVDLTATLVDTILLLWPTIHEAKDCEWLPTLLGDVCSWIGDDYQRCVPSQPFPSDIADSAVASLCLPEDLTRLNTEEARNAPKYVRVGEYITWNGDVVTSSLPSHLTHIIVFYLRTVGYRSPMREADDVFVDTILLDAPGKERVKGLLLLYRRCGVEVVSVASPALAGRCGSTQLQLLECMRKSADYLLDKQSGKLSGVPAAIGMPPGVHKYQVLLNQGTVAAKNEGGDRFAVKCFDQLLPVIRQQLQTCRECSVHIDSPKSRVGYKVKGWRPDNASDEVVIICDADTQPVLSSLYCQVVAAVSL
eukprot:TRINITY_DN11288_c0_g1_i4.p1 TRINITY_DN11288_c0_g1~~TRINITY_DN11288_c0_g1_i4.p1  ORF type:complete len:516 (+),score=51.29 TRINITY_DN11288_c0_g1_i4:64-1611(+)